jgi:hypothetical protein
MRERRSRDHVGRARTDRGGHGMGTIDFSR